jgi:hypothetical protein
VRVEADRVYARLGREAADVRRNPIPAVPGTARVLLDAAYLVPERRLARFRKEVDNLVAALSPDGYAVALTGPWPAYHFVAGPVGGRGRAAER